MRRSRRYRRYTTVKHLPSRWRGALLSRWLGQATRMWAEDDVRLLLAPSSSIQIATGSFLSEGTRLATTCIGARIIIFPCVFLNQGVRISAAHLVEIGQGTHIGWACLITDTDHHKLEGVKHTASVIIGEHVWIGANVTILKGVRIGAGAVVAAGALVASDVPKETLVMGVPAKVVRSKVSWSP